MSLKLDPFTLDKSAIAVLLNFKEYCDRSEIDPKLQHLIDIRVSQINQCAFCLDMHIQESRKSGDSAQRIDLVGVWREAPCYTEAEKAALELAEKVTLLADNRVPEELSNRLRAHYTEIQILQLLMKIIAINSFNRLVATSGRQPALR